MTVSGSQLVVAQTEAEIVAVDASNGKLVWQDSPSEQGGGGGRRGGGGRYKAATPIVDGKMIISVGAKAKAVTLEKAGDSFTPKELWSNADGAVQFNTPALKDGFIYGLNPGGQLFCINQANGETAWTAALAQSSGDNQTGGGGRGGRRGGRGGGYGSILDAGSVLMALTPSSELVVFKPNTEKFEEVARIKVSTSPTHAYPVVTDNRVFIKDQDSIALQTVD